MLCILVALVMLLFLVLIDLLLFSPCSLSFTAERQVSWWAIVEALLDPNGQFVERKIDVSWLLLSFTRHFYPLSYIASLLLQVISDPVGYGFVIRGSWPVYVHTVDPSSPAAAARLQIGVAAMVLFKCIVDIIMDGKICRMYEWVCHLKEILALRCSFKWFYHLLLYHFCCEQFAIFKSKKQGLTRDSFVLK